MSKDRPDRIADTSSPKKMAEFRCADNAIRRPTCERCGEKAVVIGSAQRFSCPCSPDLEQSIAERIRPKT